VQGGKGSNKGGEGEGRGRKGKVEGGKAGRGREKGEGIKETAEER
jgi:hypothetical protein